MADKHIQSSKKVKFDQIKVHVKPKDSIIENQEHIAKLKQQNRSMQEDLSLQYKNNDFEKMETLQNECTSYAKKIELESKKQKDLEQLIEIAEQQLQDHRKKMSNSNGVQLQYIHSSNNQLNSRVQQQPNSIVGIPSLIKKQKTLESQLEQIKLKHNESLAQINQLMEQINTARRERVIYSNVFKKLECDIRAKEEEFKKQLFIRKQIEADLAQCDEEFNKMKQQAQTLQETNQQEYNSIIKSNRDESQEDILNEPILTEDKLKQQQLVHKETFQSKQQLQQQQMQRDVDDLNQYEFMFEKLKIETGIDSIQEIIHQYRTIGDTNDELFERANQLSASINEEEKQIREIEKKLDQYSKKNQKGDLEEEEEKFQYGQQLEKSDNIDKQIKETQDDIYDIETELLELAKNLQIPIPENNGSDYTLMQLIEKRAYELIDLCNYYDHQKTNIDQGKRNIENVTQSSNREKDQMKEELTLKDLLDGIENEKEAEKILTSKDFQAIAEKELQQFGKKNNQKKKKE